MYGYPDDTDPLERSHLAKLEIVVRDEEVNPVIEIVLKHAQTGCTKNGCFRDDIGRENLSTPFRPLRPLTTGIPLQKLFQIRFAVSKTHAALGF